VVDCKQSFEHSATIQFYTVSQNAQTYKWLTQNYKDRF